MEKTIISYNENGITIAVTQLNPEEHKKVRNEVEQLGFSFDQIDADSFRAIWQGDNSPQKLNALESLGYSFV